MVTENDWEWMKAHDNVRDAKTNQRDVIHMQLIGTISLENALPPHESREPSISQTFSRSNGLEKVRIEQKMPPGHHGLLNVSELCCRCKGSHSTLKATVIIAAAIYLNFQQQIGQNPNGYSERIRLYLALP